MNLNENNTAKAQRLETKQHNKEIQLAPKNNMLHKKICFTSSCAEKENVLQVWVLFKCWCNHYMLLQLKYLNKINADQLSTEK